MTFGDPRCIGEHSDCYYNNSGAGQGSAGSFDYEGPPRRGGSLLALASLCPPCLVTRMVGWYTSRAGTETRPYGCRGWRSPVMVVHQQGGHGDPPLRKR